MSLTNLNEVIEILKTSKIIAVVGLSPKAERPSNMVARYLLEAGYTVIPVNPGQSEILEQKCYNALADIPIPVDIVDIFRRPVDVPLVVADAIKIKAKVIWMQKEIVNEEAACKAREAGLKVVMDRCIKIDHTDLL